eukprot:285801-Alexandrium_andersonii.AAC.1
MFCIRNCTDLAFRLLGDHIGTELERHGMWQMNHDVDYLGQRSLFFHDCLYFMDRAAFDFEFLPAQEAAR